MQNEEHAHIQNIAQNCGSRILGEKKFGSENFSVKKDTWTNKWWVQKILDLKQYCNHKDFGSKILFGKKMLDQRNFWVKEIMMNTKKLSSEKCLVPKI